MRPPGNQRAFPLRRPMTRDRDLVRDVLLRIEKRKLPDLSDIITDEDDRDSVAYHVGIMVDAGFLSGIPTSSIGDSYRQWLNLDLTWDGHEFLDDVRDSAAWRRAKSVAAKAGSESVRFLWDVAKEFAKSELRRHIAHL